MNNAVYGKRMKNVINRIGVQLVSNEKGYLKWTAYQGYLSQKIFEKLH